MNLVSDLRIRSGFKALRRISQAALVVASSLIAATGIAYAQRNPGDPFFCQPNEGINFLIVNGGNGVFTDDGDCYGSNLGSTAANTPPSSIMTSQGGLLTLAGGATPFASGQANYIYTPPTPGFTGLDTFSLPVGTVWNSAGGPGSAGGSSRPGGPATITNVTLVVLPATTTLMASGPTLLPIPAGFITGCGAQGNAGQGPPPSAVSGCVTRIAASTFGGVSPSHGTLSVSGNTLRYTPTAGYSGPDTFTYEVRGVNTDGQSALSSGNVTEQVTVNPAIVISTTSLPGGTLNSAYSQTLMATGGFPPFTFSVSAGSLPPGLTLSSTGVLSGTPTANGTFNFTVQVTDSASNTVSAAFSLVIGTNTPTGVPTLGAWGMFLLCGSLVLYGLKAVSRAGA